MEGEVESLNKRWHLTLGSESEMPGLSCAKGIKLAREGACDLVNCKLGTRSVTVVCVYEVLRAGALAHVGDSEVLW